MNLMSDAVLPSLFLSHGAPSLALEPGATGAFWRALAESLPRPQAVLCVSAHWNTTVPLVSVAEQPETIHDFYGFPETFYRIAYPAPGAPAMAERALGLLRAAGIPGEPARYGLDHGAWVPLRNFYPHADVPVAQLSVQPRRDARWHMALGAALAPLRGDGVLVLTSGGATHNLRELDWGDGAPPPWAKEFDEWLAAALAQGKIEDLLDWERKAPYAHRAHPSPEHLLPLFVGLGAAGEGARGERLYQDFTMGGLSMAAFRFAA